jgi:hypothetical protein
MDNIVLAIAFAGTVTFFTGITFALFLLYLTLKIKSEFRETLRLEVDKHRKMYSYIGQVGKADVEDLVEKFEGVRREDIEFPAAYLKWQKFLLKRIREKGTLVGSKSQVSLSDDVKRFFVYDNPSIGDLFRYINTVYLKRQPFSV